MEIKVLFTTAPKSFDYDETEVENEAVGTHKLGFTVRKVSVPVDRSYRQVEEYWLAHHMAVDAEEFAELVSRGLVQVSS